MKKTPKNRFFIAMGLLAFIFILLHCTSPTPGIDAPIDEVDAYGSNVVIDNCNEQKIYQCRLVWAKTNRKTITRYSRQSPGKEREFKIGRGWHPESRFLPVQDYCTPRIENCGYVTPVNHPDCIHNLSGIRIPIVEIVSCHFTDGIKRYRLENTQRFIYDNGLIECEIFEQTPGCKLVLNSNGFEYDVYEKFTDSAGVVWYRVGTWWFNALYTDFTLKDCA